MRTALIVILLAGITSLSCLNETHPNQNRLETKTSDVAYLKKVNRNGIRTVHVFVALCDNRYQGIIPVGKAIGNGQDPASNLYWGCDNGLKTYFKKKTSDWTLLKTEAKISDTILERLIFKHKTQNVYLLAEAYNGKFIKPSTIDFLEAAAGENSEQFIYGKDSIYFGGASNLIAYIGHDGSMDFKLPLQKSSVNNGKRETIILACYSQYYFSPHIKNAGATPLLGLQI